MPILHWLTRDQDIGAAKQVPYRLLEEVPDLGAGEPGSGNMLIQGDNLDALKSLLPYYAGRVKCIYIDPPYNTRSAFEHYDDNLEHSKWLAMMWPRLELLRDLLAEDGSIWVSIDENEAHYLKVIMDEVFGRQRFVVSTIWRTTDNSNNNAKTFSLDHNYILTYSKSPGWTPQFLNDENKRQHFKNPDGDPRGPWFDGNPVNNPARRPNLMFNLVGPYGDIIKHPPNGWRWSRETIEEKLKAGEIRYTPDGKAIRRRTYLADMAGLPPSSLWANLEETGHNRQAKYELKSLFPESAVTDLFATPKPERLIKRLLELSTNPGDIVLDSFLGSGTTSAVAHKMGRQYIGIEIGDHAITHCEPRLKKVVDGEQGGISESVGWKGGGGFRFYRLGSEVFDANGHISTNIRFPVLAAHIWFAETGQPWQGSGKSPFLGVNDGHAFALLYNGILGDKRPEGGNVLTRATLDLIQQKIAKKEKGFGGPITIYGEQCRLGAGTLTRAKIAFKQTPYDVKIRR